MFKRIIMMILILLIGTVLVFALDDQGNPNDPAINERANACYEDGTLAGQCDTELEWQAGWYLIRYEFGILQRADIPEWVEWILAPEATPEFMSPVMSMPPVACPNLSFTCTQLFSCAEADACLTAGNTSLDPDNDNIPCNEAGNLLLGTIQCN